MSGMLVTVVSPGMTPKLFVGDVLYNEGPSEADATQFVCKDLTKSLTYLLTKNQIQDASNGDVFSAFLIKSGSWVFHTSKGNIDYLAKVVAIDLPYLEHETGNDMIYNFIPALDDAIEEYRVNKATDKGFVVGAKVKDKNKVLGVIHSLKLDPKTKDLMVSYWDGDNVNYESPLQQVKLIKKAKEKKEKVEQISNP